MNGLKGWASTQMLNCSLADVVFTLDTHYSVPGMHGCTVLCVWKCTYVRIYTVCA